MSIFFPFGSSLFERQSQAVVAGTGEGRQPVQRVLMKVVLLLLWVLGLPPTGVLLRLTCPRGEEVKLCWDMCIPFKRHVRVFYTWKGPQRSFRSTSFTDEKTEAQQGQVIWPRLCVCQSLSHLRLFVIPGTVARQAPLSMEFSRQEYWDGLSFLPPGDLPEPGIEPGSPALQADSLPSEPPGESS